MLSIEELRKRFDEKLATFGKINIDEWYDSYIGHQRNHTYVSIEENLILVPLVPVDNLLTINNISTKDRSIDINLFKDIEYDKFESNLNFSSSNIFSINKFLDAA